MSALSSEQLNILGNYANSGDRIGYYSYLSLLGDKYGGLALGVVNNSSGQGAIANTYLEQYAAAVGKPLNHDTMAAIGIALMQPRRVH